MPRSKKPNQGLCFILLLCWNEPNNPSFFKDTLNFRLDEISPMLMSLKKHNYIQQVLIKDSPDSRKNFYQTNKITILNKIKEILKLSDIEYERLETLVKELSEDPKYMVKITEFISKISKDDRLESFQQIPLMTIMFLILILKDALNIVEREDNENVDQPEPFDFIKNLFEKEINREYYNSINEIETEEDEEFYIEIVDRILTAFTFYEFFPDMNPFE